MDPCLEAQAPVALFIGFHDSCLHYGGLTLQIPQNDLGAEPRAFARAEHDPPIVWRVFFEQQNLEGATRPGVCAAQARRNDAGIIENQDIARPQIFEQIAKPPMFGLP